MSDKINYFEKIENSKQKEFIQLNGHCTLCCSPLEMKHDIKTEDNQIQEQATCTECDVRARVKIYTLN